ERGVRPVGAALIVRARRKDLVLRAAVLAHETAEIAETTSAAELPECLLTEEQRGRRILRRRRRRDRRHRGRLEVADLRRRRAERVADRHHGRVAAGLALAFRLDEARVDAGDHRDGIIATLPDLREEQRRLATVFRRALWVRSFEDRNARV